MILLSLFMLFTASATPLFSPSYSLSSSPKIENPAFLSTNINLYRHLSPLSNAQTRSKASKLTAIRGLPRQESAYSHQISESSYSYHSIGFDNVDPEYRRVQKLINDCEMKGYRECNLSGKEIKSLKGIDFSDDDIIHLEFNKNHIENLKGVKRWPPFLKSLSLKCNQIDTLSIYDIPFRRTLNELHLRSNHLTSYVLETFDFTAFRQLQYLDLSQNKIHSLYGINFGDTITDLYLDDNQYISDFSNTHFPKKLQKLDISNMMLTSNEFNTINFKLLPHLRWLGMDKCIDNSASVKSEYVPIKLPLTLTSLYIDYETLNSVMQYQRVKEHRIFLPNLKEIIFYKDLFFKNLTSQRYLDQQRMIKMIKRDIYKYFDRTDKHLAIKIMY